MYKRNFLAHLNALVFSQETVYLSHSRSAKMNYHKFSVMLPDKECANNLHDTLSQRGSHRQILKIDINESSFCLGKKVVLQIMTDDKEFFIGTDKDALNWLDNALQGLEEMWDKILKVETTNYWKETNSSIGFCAYATHHTGKINEIF